MARCPHCDGKLTQRDFDQGQCIHCKKTFFMDAAPENPPTPGGTQATLDSAMHPLPPGALSGRPGADGPGAVARSTDQTLDSGSFSASPERDIHTDPTLDSGSFSASPAAALPLEPDESQRVTQTLDSSLSFGPAPQKDQSAPPQDYRTDPTLDSGSFPGPPAAAVPPESDESQRVTQTLDSSLVFPSAPQEEGPSSELDHRTDLTLDSGSFAPAPSAGTASPSSDSRATDQTLDSATFPAVPQKVGGGTFPGQRLDKTLDSVAFADLAAEKAAAEAADLREAQTLDSESFSAPSAADSQHVSDSGPPQGRSGTLAGRVTAGAPRTIGERRELENIEQRVSRVWSGKYQSDATPHTSIKTSSASVEQESSLVIQTRVFRRSKGDRTAKPDYDLLGQLGEGGMGVVLAARQASIDRLVAVKMLKPGGAKDLQSRQKFLSEAVVTGDLEHPNIVPIYDLGTDDTGALFYSMKRVKGTPWHKAIKSKSFQENIEILLKVADAVAFAHSRGVVHRDLKPENIMLGDFGEVLVMDWGLALTPGSGTASMGGTPAYMAPEMAFGPADKCTFAADIYLLGAMLFEIETGNPPHSGKNVLECLFAASKNRIRPTEKRGELIDVAMKAMATAPQDRYATVGDFQNAIRQYLSHSQSLALSTRAEADLRQALEADDYEIFARARFGFQEAFALWDGNAEAKEGIARSSAAYARSALGKGDYDLGASLLDAAHAEHRAIRDEIEAARREREARQQRLRTAKRIGVGLAATVFVVVTVAFFWIRAEAENARQAEGVAEARRQDAVHQRGIAEQQRSIAEEQSQEAKKQTVIARNERSEAIKQKNIADQQRTEALRQKTIADDQRTKAQTAQRLAEDSQKKEEYGAYVARIGLAAAKIEENAFDRAIALLEECPEHLRDWEWGRLMHLCAQEVRTFDARQPVDTVAFAPDGKRFATGGWGGVVRIWEPGSGKQLAAIPTGGQYVFAVAFSPDGQQIAVGTNEGPNYVKVFDAQTSALVKSLAGHTDAVTSVVYSGDGKRLLTSSYDNTARLWNIASGESQVFEGHEWWVWSAAFSPDEKRIVTACQDGSAIVWSVATRQPGPAFLGHAGPVYAAVFSPDGKHVASAGYDKRILLWDPDQVQPFDLGALTAKREKAAASYAALEGHTSGVRSVRFSSDGKILLSAGNDNTVRVWDVATCRLLKTLRGHAGRVQACVFAPDRGWVLSGSHDHLAKIWNIAGYEEVRVFQGLVLEGHRDAILGADFSPDGSRIVSASRDRSAKLWDAHTGKPLRQFKEGHDFLATRAVFLPDGKRLITAAGDNTVRIWDVATGTQQLAMEGTGSMAAMALSRDGRLLLTGSDDRAAKLWDVTSGSLLRTLPKGRSEVTAVAISPDSRLLFAGDARGRCRLYDAGTGGLRWETEHHSRAVTAAAFLPSGDGVLTASIDNTVAQWDAATGRERLPWILKHPGSVFSMALSPDGRQVLTACSDKAVRVWDCASGRELGIVTAGGETINSVAYSPEGRRAITTDALGNVRLWDLEHRRELHVAPRNAGPFLSPKAMPVQAWSAIFAPDGFQVLTVGGNEAALWEVKTGRQNVRFSPHNSVASARFSPDGRQVVTASWDKTARIWDARKAVAELRLEGGHSQYVNDAAFSPDGARVVTAGDDKLACVWDARTGKLFLTLRGHRERVSSAVFSPDGKRILTASNDKTARIWDAATGRTLRELTGHREAVLYASYSRDGRRIITGGEDNEARLWDAETGRQAAFSLQGHTAPVTSVAFSPNGHRAITGSLDNTAKVWDANTGKELLTLKGHTQEITTVEFSPDGRSALTGSRDGTLLLWLATEWRKPPRPAATAAVSPTAR